ncbi:MAG: hypothetical protein B7Z55_03310 [Planctomycetales bacterium 12-60-4]|nr:MAG: hypothetical protein B7Z55_03310 [Planctomycetales bacterium 12-60-4]
MRPPMSAATNPEWLNDVCRKLSQALGCELTYSAAVEPAESCVVPRSHIVWQASVHDGQEVTGKLQLCASDSATHGADSQAANAVGTATVFAEILERLVSAERRLESVDHDPLLSNLSAPGNLVETPPQIVRRFLRTAQQASRSWGTAFFLKEAAGQSLHLRACDTVAAEEIPQHRRCLSQAPDSMAISQGSLIIRAEGEWSEHWLPRNCRSAFIVPVRTTEGCLGTLWCLERRERVWADPEIRRLTLVADHLAAALERTLLLRESDARRRLSHELAFASTYHPGHAMGLMPQDSGLDIAMRVTSAAALGGDLCEVWPIGEGHTLLAIGDATGHSVPAAMIMSAARGSLRTLLASGRAELKSTDLVAARLNRALHSVTRGEQFMSLLCGVYERSRNTLVYTNAGHPPPWHIREGRATSLRSHGMLLGIFPDSVYERSQIALQPGDWLVGYTDGITEALSREREMFCSTGVLAAMEDGRFDSAAAAADAIWSAVQRHSAGAQATDDQSLLVLRVMQ